MNISMIGYAEEIEDGSYNLDLLLNGEGVEISTAGLSTVGDLLEKVRLEKFSQKEFISKMEIDGEVVEDRKQDVILGKQLSEVDLISISTDTPVTVSLRTLNKVDDFLASISQLVEESADKFRLEDESVANQHFLQVVEALQTFVEILSKVKVLNNMDFAEITHGSSPVNKREEALLNVFASIHDVQKNRDWVGMADVLEYELVPIITDWKEIIPVLCELIVKKNN
ncbi:MAG: hypothetical protein OEW04_14575 [Nitrospirota bacterium]|nr:hypothetical protein [Nitrospirota bacterium]